MKMILIGALFKNIQLMYPFYGLKVNLPNHSWEHIFSYAMTNFALPPYIRSLTYPKTHFALIAFIRKLPSRVQWNASITSTGIEYNSPTPFFSISLPLERFLQKNFLTRTGSCSAWKGTVSVQLFRCYISSVSDPFMPSLAL
jgi:hypothetical protein